MRLLVFLFLISGVSWGSTSEPHGEQDSHEESSSHHAPKGGELHYISKRLSRFDRETRIPKTLVKEIEKHFIKHFRIVRQESPLEDHEVRRKIPRRYLNLTIEMERDGSEALEQNYRFKTVQGSGVLDVRDSISKDFGHFKLRVRADREGSHDPISQKSIQLFFVGEVRGERIGEDEFGSGCNKWLDLSKWFQKELSKDGVEVFVKDGRHLRVFGGTFYFVHFWQGTLYLSTLTLRDSKYSGERCPKG